MSRKFVVLRELSDQCEAEILRGRLAGAGIESFVQPNVGAQSFGAGQSIQHRGVRLNIDADDYEAARALLEFDQNALATAGRWQCSRCQETNEPAFEICWSCQKQRDRHSVRLDDALEDRRGEGIRPAALSDDPLVWTPSDRAYALTPAQSTNPYHPVSQAPPAMMPPTSSGTPDGQPMQWEARASVRLTVIGLLLFPPILNIAAIAMVIRLMFTSGPSVMSKKLAFSLVLVNVVLVVGFGWLFWWRWIS